MYSLLRRLVMLVRCVHRVAVPHVFPSGTTKVEGARRFMLSLALSGRENILRKYVEELGGYRWSRSPFVKEMER